jgi:TPP-dependent pyruvate/acetoin dehydrogenase alpha subunit
MTTITKKSALKADELETARGLYETMVRIRKFEERAGELFQAGEMPGFIHLSLGQEAVPAGIIGALDSGDFVTATHRGHGHIIAKGADLGRMMAELYGKDTGYCRGKGGSMHIFDLSLGVLGANGILGAGQPIAVGAALSAQMAGSSAIVASFFGEGASAQGAVHEAMNLAAVWQVPVLFVAEVNGFAELTPYEVHASVGSLAQRGAGYGIAASTVDGLDALAVYEAARAAVADMRRDGAPRLIEARMTRWRGHYEGDPQKYRTPEDIARGLEGDPIALMAQRLRDGGVDQTALEAVEESADHEIEAAVAFARASADPAAAAALDHVYVEPLPADRGPR